MSGRTIATQGIPLTLRFSKGERNPFFNRLLGLLASRSRARDEGTHHVERQPNAEY
jgi:hypothetical protein